MNNENSQYCKGYCELHFNPQTSQTIQFLKELFSLYTSRIYIVGGYVRDQYMNLNRSNDIDLEVYDIDQELFDTLMNQIGAKGVGQSFFVYKYEDIDISLPRKESKIAFGHTGFEVQQVDNERVAARRRDFTMNALMVNLYTNELYDFYGGVEDIQNKIIRIIDEKSFQEDSLRVLRAMRFASTFGFKIEQESCKIMQQMSIDDLSNERIINEFMKMFDTKYLYYGLYYCISLNILIQFFDTTIDKMTFYKIYRLLKKNRKYFNVKIYNHYFLYILNNFTNIDIQSLGFPKKMTREILSQKAYEADIDLLQLHIIALQMPIKDWLGAINPHIINTAKNYNIYNKCVQTNVDVQEIIKEGFEKEEIGLELQRRKIKFIHDKIIDNIKK